MIEKHDIDMYINTMSMKLPTQLIADNSQEDVEIELLIREKYSLSNELAIHRKKLLGIIEDEEWNEYNNYVLECIEKAREKEPMGE